ncbi:unnamed protein product [Allacma fusca]|uniref:Uncharacterized protein n=1 Tax=Allacma fusca TaxID=39272 RepID=A0A8J2KAE5_9HEXA|nr:unnamed protein product [Allacma fusca]
MSGSSIYYGTMDVTWPKWIFGRPWEPEDDNRTFYNPCLSDKPGTHWNEKIVEINADRLSQNKKSKMMSKCFLPD